MALLHSPEATVAGTQQTVPDHHLIDPIINAFANPFVLYGALFVLPGASFYVFYRFTRWFFPDLSPQIIIAVAVSIAAFTAVFIHELHTHSHGHFYDMARDCLDDPEYCGKFYEGR